MRVRMASSVKAAGTSEKVKGATVRGIWEMMGDLSEVSLSGTVRAEV